MRRNVLDNVTLNGREIFSNGTAAAAVKPKVKEFHIPEVEIAMPSFIGIRKAAYVAGGADAIDSIDRLCSRNKFNSSRIRKINKVNKKRAHRAKWAGEATLVSELRKADDEWSTCMLDKIKHDLYIQTMLACTSK